MIHSKGHGRMPFTTNVDARIHGSARTFRDLDPAAPQITPGPDRMADGDVIVCCEGDAKRAAPMRHPTRPG